MTYQEAVKYGIQALKLGEIDNPEYDARELFLFAAAMPQTEFFIHIFEEVPDALFQKYQEMILKRKKHVPLQHLLGTAGFYGRDFIVSEDVLIPRYDTEVLVNQILIDYQDEENREVLDLCTGSGIIGITIAAEKKSFRVTASDISEKALEIAKRNQAKHQVKVDLLQSDLFEKIDGRFDIIACNPPYIRLDEKETLSSEVRDFDPEIALYGGESGLTFYERIIPELSNHLNENGRIYFEIGCTQGKDVSQLLENAGFQNIHVVKDFQDFDRVVIGEKV